MTEPQSFKADICKEMAPQDTFLFGIPKNVAVMRDSPTTIWYLNSFQDLLPSVFMADPFSIIAATAGLSDVCWRFGSYLHNLQAGAAKTDDEIERLTKDIEALKEVNEIIRASYKELPSYLNPEVESSKHVERLWQNVSSNLKGCRSIVEELEVLTTGIVGRKPREDESKFMRKLGRFKKELRKQSKEDDFDKLQTRLNNYYNSIQLMFDLIIWTHAQQSHSNTSESLKELKVDTSKSLDEIKDGVASLQSQISLAEAQSLRDSLSSAIFLASPNEHYSVPQGVEKNYTGRTGQLNDVNQAFNAPSAPGEVGLQKRIVIYGLGGSGKTQFCCKYASLCRQSYWGIFWINASSEELARQTFQDIAKAGGVADNVGAAKHWLSNLKYRWLLIIDNADNPQVKLDQYFPEGERGHVLLTTRIPAHRDYGTVGSQFLHFEGLDENDGKELLLKAASKPLPPDSLTERLATSITQALGSLPLALIHAGKAIKRGLCRLDDYIRYHKIERQRVRDAQSKGFLRSDEIYINVYSSFEINFQSLVVKATAESREGRTEAKDAIQLLQMFSFFHRENIRLEFLTKAIVYPNIEEEQRLMDQQKEAADNSGFKKRSCAQTFKEIAMDTVVFLSKDRTPPVLPDGLRDIDGFDRDNEVRLRAALNELTQLSLITYNENDDNYSMHPVVHSWARERPDFSTKEQAIWCQAAVTTLAQCILLPPFANSEEDERFRRDLLPHVDHVRQRQQEIQETISLNRRKSRRPSWAFSKSTKTRTQIIQLARFSRVYAQCGRWDEAKNLQLEVKDFVAPLGPEHPSTIRIKLALSVTCYQLGQANEAAELQNQVLQAHTTTFGEDHPDTLKVMDVLGESRWQQGQFTVSLELHERAFNGMTRKLGPNHENTLKAADNLGRAHATFWRMEKARELSAMAVTGMRNHRKLGPMHLDTLVAMDHLALAYLEINPSEYNSGEDLDRAYELLFDVLNSREKKLGKEHPYTLWAAANLARVKTAQGNFVEAESDIRAGLMIAIRNLGAQHIGTLYGKLYLGDNLCKQGRIPEAIELLIEVADGHRHMASANDGEHPDRVAALHRVCICYQRQGKLDEAVKACEEAIQGLAAIGGQDHPYTKKLNGIMEELNRMRISSRAEPAPENVPARATEGSSAG